MKRFFLIISAALVSLSAWAQKPALDHSVYDGWNSIVRPVDQMDKEWVIYGIRPQEGDGTLYLQNLVSGAECVVERGADLKMARDGSFGFFTVKAPFAATRQAKIDKKKPDEQPKDSLARIDLRTLKWEMVGASHHRKSRAASPGICSCLTPPPAARTR